VWRIDVESRKLDLQFSFEFTPHDSMVWAQPLSPDSKKYFFTHKTVAMPLKGQMTL